MLACIIGPATHRGALTMRLSHLLFIPLFAVTFVACNEAPKPHIAPEPPPAATNLAEPKQIALAIDGMTCDACVKSVTAEFRKTGSVGECAVDLKTKEARLTYDAARLKEDDLLIAVRRAGYTAKVKP
jgi:copper chaperone CopZ